MLKDGLYEKVINSTLFDELATMQEKFQETSDIDSAEAAKVLSQYVAQLVERGLKIVSDKGEVWTPR